MTMILGSQYDHCAQAETNIQNEDRHPLDKRQGFYADSDRVRHLYMNRAVKPGTVFLTQLPS